MSTGIVLSRALSSHLFSLSIHFHGSFSSRKALVLVFLTHFPFYKDLTTVDNDRHIHHACFCIISYNEKVI